APPTPVTVMDASVTESGSSSSENWTTTSVVRLTSLAPSGGVNSSSSRLDSGAAVSPALPVLPPLPSGFIAGGGRLYHRRSQDWRTEVFRYRTQSGRWQGTK